MTDLLNAAQTVLEFSLKIAEVGRNMEMKCVILETFALYYHVTKNVEMRRKALNECIEIATKINHLGFIDSARKKYEHFEKAPPVIMGPKDIPKSTEADFEKLSEDEIDKMHRFLLKRAGIDPEGKGELSEMARVGLKDRNPERVLKHCKYLYTEIVFYGPIWDMVGLPTTGQKILFCEKNGWIVGWKLDDLFEEFKKTKCSGCKAHSPRPTGWKWTYKWQREQGTPEKMKEIVKKIRRS
jgi:hypothetical protein